MFHFYSNPFSWSFYMRKTTELIRQFDSHYLFSFRPFHSSQLHGHQQFVLFILAYRKTFLMIGKRFSLWNWTENTTTTKTWSVISLKFLKLICELLLSNTRFIRLYNYSVRIEHVPSDGLATRLLHYEAISFDFLLRHFTSIWYKLAGTFAIIFTMRI